MGFRVSGLGADQLGLHFLLFGLQLRHCLLMGSGFRGEG